jgi:aspartate carbamoyltransferase catalytic subunit
LDAFTVRQVLCERHDTTGLESGAAMFEGLRILIVGDIRHSRVARSDVAAYATLGAEVRLCAPGTLLPEEVATWPVTVVHDFDEALAWADVVGLLRLQSERGSGAFVASLDEFTFTNGLTVERARLMKPEALIMHPGPMNRGVEIDSRVVDSSRAVVERQVSNGVPIRMAVLYLSVAGSGEGQTL